MHTITLYERRFINNGQVSDGLNVFEVVVEQLIQVRKVYSYLNNKWTCTRITECVFKGHTTEVTRMTSFELDGWGSFKSDTNLTATGLRNELIKRGVITRPSHESEPCLRVDVWAVKSHIEDMERVVRGEEPTPPQGMNEDDDIYAF